MSKLGQPKNLLKSTRDKFLSSVLRSLDYLDNRVKHLEEMQSGLDQINAQRFDQLEQKIASRGTIQLSDKEIMTKIFSGAKMYLDPGDIAITPHLVLDGEWEHNITRAWTSLIAEDMVVVDIGANFGYFGLLAAQMSNRKSNVIIFEANPNLIPYLQKTMQLNSFDKCTTIENLALSDKTEKVELNVLKDYIASSSLHSINRINAYNSVKQQVARTVSVQATTLDEYCQKRDIKKVNLIKMDIEGYEEKAYQGMKQIVRSNPDISLFVEFTKEAYENPQKFYQQMLKDFGNVYLIDEQGVIVKPKQTSYDSVIGKDSAWVMPIFSKNKNLAA